MLLTLEQFQLQTFISFFLHFDLKEKAKDCQKPADYMPVFILAKTLFNDIRGKFHVVKSFAGAEE